MKRYLNLFCLAVLIAFLLTPNPVRHTIAIATTAMIRAPVPTQTQKPSKSFPLAIAPTSARVTSEFGPRATFATSTGRASSIHRGIDLACAVGDPVVAIQGGTTEYIDSDPNGWGITLAIITHEHDEWIYAHLSDRTVPNHSLVNPGDAIAKCGQTGSATGPHLHLEQKPDGGAAINPRPFLEGLGLKA